MTKLERLTRAEYRSLNVEQRDAVDRLLWAAPPAAERARLKKLLGWQPRRDESRALALELLADGLVKRAVADRLGVSDRYLRRLLAEPPEKGVDPARNRPANPHRERPAAELNGESRPVTWPVRPRPAADRFRDIRGAGRLARRGAAVNARDRLASALAPELLAALEELVDERVAAALVEAEPAGDVARWLTLEQAAGRLGCTPDAVRMRVQRGRLESRRQGRRVYVSATSVDGLA